MPDPKPTAKTIVLDLILDVIEMLLFLAKLALLIVFVLAVGATVFGVSVRTLQTVAADTVQHHGPELQLSLAVLLAATILTAVMRALWRRWPIFE